jgi:hypothetical protein
MTTTVNADGTVAIFDQYYSQSLVVNANEYDIVYSFFIQYLDQAVAATYSEVIFRVAQISGVDALTLLKQLEGSNALNVSLTMAYYLNSVGNNYFMYGGVSFPAPNEKYQRNIVQ